jgi:hypothetical protein
MGQREKVARRQRRGAHEPSLLHSANENDCAQAATAHLPTNSFAPRPDDSAAMAVGRSPITRPDGGKGKGGRRVSSSPCLSIASAVDRKGSHAGRNAPQVAQRVVVKRRGKLTERDAPRRRAANIETRTALCARHKALDGGGDRTDKSGASDQCEWSAE